MLVNVQVVKRIVYTKYLKANIQTYLIRFDVWQGTVIDAPVE